jgi:hypothetical protein
LLHFCGDYIIWVPIHQKPAAISPLAGMVRIQAIARLIDMSQRTRFMSCAAPAPAMVWVVDSGAGADQQQPDDADA